MPYYVYIVTNRPNGTLYIGVTNNLPRRIEEHKTKAIEGFTQRYDLTKLVYVETTNDINAAITREKQLKHWNRAWKIRLITEHNPNWKDLSSEIFI